MGTKIQLAVKIAFPIVIFTFHSVYDKIKSETSLFDFGMKGCMFMKILIGENIKRLRREKDMTQEALAEYLNVSIAAVSKWERNETYPDITLLFPLAQFFGVTLDILMGYDEAKIKGEIDAVMQEYRHLSWKERTSFITKAYHDYPNSDVIMYRYMWDIAGDWADNDPKVLLERKDELLAICDRILAISVDESLRLDTWNMRAKILHAEGKTEEALDIYNEKFTSWYHTKEQKSEQLFAKDTPEFRRYLRNNLYELSDFAADKRMKEIWFCHDDSIAEKTEKSFALAGAMGDMYEAVGGADILFAQYSVYLSLKNAFRRFGGRAEDCIRADKESLSVALKIDALAKEDESVMAYLLYRFGETLVK